MKNTSLLLEYIEKHYDRLVEAYGKAVVDAVKADFKKQMTDNPGVPGFSDPITKKPFTDDQLDTFIDAFDKIRSSLPSPQNDIYNYTTSKDKFELDDFFSLLAKKDKLTSKKDKEAEIPDVIYSSEDGNIKIFNGNREDLCTRFSREVPWCITKGSWTGYRYDPNRGYPTFYLVKNSNLPDNDKLSFVAIQARANDNWVYTNRKNNPYESRVMNWETLNSEIPWLSQIPDAKSKMPWVDISDQEKEERSFRDKPIPYSTWDLYLTPNQKLRYINIRNGRQNYGDNGKLFSDMSEEKFVSEYFPKLDKSLRGNLLRNQTLNIDYLVDNYENPNFTDEDKALILRFYLQEGRLNIDKAEELLEKTTVPFQLKKDIITKNKIAENNRYRFFINNENEIVEIIFNQSLSDINIKTFTNKNGVTLSKEIKDVTPKTGTKYLLNYPELDTFPFKVLLKLAGSEIIPDDLIKKVIEKAKNDPNSSIIVRELEDGSTFLIDTNAFEAYKSQNGQLNKIPFDSEEIQNILSNEQGNNGVIDNILEIFTNAKRIPDSISKQTILSLTKNLEPEKRFITFRGEPAFLIPAENINDTNLFKILYLNKNGGLQYPILYGGEGEYWREPNRDWQTAFTPEDFRFSSDYFRSKQETYSDDNLRDIFQSAPRGGQAIVNFINSNPPLNPANIYRPIIYQNSLYLFNTQNPGNSLRLGAGGRLINKSFNNRDVAAITGQEVPAARRVRQAAPAAGGEEAGAETPAAAPAAGEANEATAAIIEEYGLTNGVNALPTALRNIILAGRVIATDNGFQGVNNALGNRGRVVRIIANGSNRMYIIRLTSGTYIARVSYQPGARHYIITANNAFRINRVGDFIDALTARNLAEGAKETLMRLVLPLATKEELGEIKSNFKKKPYKNIEITESYIIREFDENIDPIELKWHRDREDRIVEIVGKTDWKLQLENQLPISINQPISIPKGEWHRVIKGTGKLTLKIIKEESTQYNFAGVLITNTSTEDGRPQKDILSDIRAIEGITIVTSKDYDASGETNAFNNPNYYSIIKVKVDPNPYSTGFTSEDLQNMLKEIRAIKGVKNFKLNQAVEKTTV
jgi:hypothetical protein